MTAKLRKTRKKRRDNPSGKADTEKKLLGPADLLPPTPNTFAGPTEYRCECGKVTIVFKSEFGNARDLAITLLNLGDCAIGAQIYTGVADGKPTPAAGSGSGLAAKNASTSLGGSVPVGGGFMVTCQGDGTGSCRFYWRIDKV